MVCGNANAERLSAKEKTGRDFLRGISVEYSPKQPMANLHDGGTRPRGSALRLEEAREGP